MIALCQNTNRTITVNGKQVTVWEGRSQAGIRFHLFSLGTQPMGTIGTADRDRFVGEMTDVKNPPSNETAALPPAMDL